MDNAVYATLNRQSGLMQEMRTIANNISNISTAGFRKEGVIFAEHIARGERGEESLSMAFANGRVIDQSQGPLAQTGGSFDFAIEGEGFFQIETPQGNQLTRAGAFTPNENGELVNMDGHRLLDNGGAPIFIPADSAPIAVGGDGTISADGAPLAQIGIFMPTDPNGLIHQGGTRFEAPDGIEAVEGATILQGYIEESNVNAIGEISRMIEVQRAYELGQTFLDKEDERIRGVISTLTR